MGKKHLKITTKLSKKREEPWISFLKFFGLMNVVLHRFSGEFITSITLFDPQKNQRRLSCILVISQASKHEKDIGLTLFVMLYLAHNQVPSA
jgi:hypothetical protein